MSRDRLLADEQWGANDDFSLDDCVRHFNAFVNTNEFDCDFVEISDEAMRVLNLAWGSEIEDDSIVDYVVTAACAAAEDRAYERTALVFGVDAEAFSLAIKEASEGDLIISMSSFSEHLQRASDFIASLRRGDTNAVLELSPKQDGQIS